MACRVRLARWAERDVALLWDDIHAEVSDGAERWFKQLEDTVARLGDSPRMGTSISEDTALR